ncbi:rhomboid family intramembrane serine protease [Hymenobacter sp. BT770]|uniref:rhomboid family intramembrane serine protease n=1 Tax=Hymenobacter sp. BT770 TaxID=2886942 RepID=UPI001D12D550|nr:rhomboid family intramembrane serine protease [Hymenobacter sp. BT770]MCC3154274.1 rhomboid family intramembrane serine protease [Hymenobacter sp. BT770]MDO3416346.1 rhomboid family intramembrane serine protease [Hymenobacter sp. BT770]
MEAPDPDNGSSAASSTAALAAQLFAQKPEAELLYLAQNAARYPPAVGAAAVAELERRGLLPAPGQPVPPPPAEDQETWAELIGHLFKGLFIPSRRFLATPILLDLNLLVFGLMLLNGVSASSPSGHQLMRWGSNVSGLTLNGEPWRLLTCLFIHAGLSHLLLNMFSLWLLGLLVEDRVGPVRLVLVYLASGVGGGLASLWWHVYGINSVGASGAIFGLYGFLLTLLVSKRLVLDKSDRRAMLGLVIYLVLSNLLSGLTGNIDNAAHIGGLLTGLFVAGPLALAGLKKTLP